MEGNVSQYLASVNNSLPQELMNSAARRKLNHMANFFRGFAASEYIFESHLDNEAAEIDFSFRVLAEEKACLNLSSLSSDSIWTKIDRFVSSWSQGIEDIWFEMDDAQQEQAIPQPCFFFNASHIKNDNRVDYNLLLNALRPLLDHEQLNALKGNLKAVIEHLPAKVGLFQVGVMLSRNSDQVRVFTEELTKNQVFEYLTNIGWRGSITPLEQLFQLVHSYSDGQYIVDFDVTSLGVAEKIGINFGLDKRENLPLLLDNLVKHQLCADVKRKGVLAWSGSQGSFNKDISHFKVSYLPATGLKAKVYLRVKGIYLKEVLKAKKPAQNKEVELRYKELQAAFKEIAKRAMLDQDYRELCLKDSGAAIQKVVTDKVKIPEHVVFLEQDDENIAGAGLVYVLPPFLKQGWLLSK